MTRLLARKTRNPASFGVLFLLAILVQPVGAQPPTFVWAGQMGGTGADRGFGIAVDGSGNVYTTGNFEGTADFDPGVGVFNLTSFGFDDIFVSKLADPPTISVVATQASPGAPVFVNNTNLTTGNEYYNIFSFDLCIGGAGAGPFGGLCVTTPGNLQFILSQLLMPVGTPLTHFIAPSSNVSWGPFSLPPLTVDALCFDFTGGVLGPISQVATIAVQ